MAKEAGRVVFDENGKCIENCRLKKRAVNVGTGTCSYLNEKVFITEEGGGPSLMTRPYCASTNPPCDKRIYGNIVGH